MKYQTESGFTLIELMIVVGIVAIVSALAIYNYGESASKSKRTDGRTALLSTAATLEKCKSIYGVYNNTGCSIGNGDSIDSPEGLYQVSVTSTTTTFSLTATPQGSQAGDDCTSMTLNHLQQQGGSPDADTCW